MPAAVALLWSCGEDRRDVDGGSSPDADADTDADPDAGADAGEGDTDAVVDCAGGRLDTITHLCWQEPRADGEYNWLDALTYCTDLELGGHTDWVLPDRGQVVSIFDNCDSEALGDGAGFCDACAESETCSSLFGPDELFYWTSTQFSEDFSWNIDFDMAGIGTIPTSENAYVRCVRSEL
jgi:hypothetical protein